MDAFWRLNSDRPFHMGGAGPIQFSSIDAYARRYDVSDPETFDYLLSLIRVLDHEYLKLMAPDKGKGRKVSPTDTEGVKAVLHRAAKKASD